MVKIVIFDVMGVIFTVGDDTGELLIPYITSLKNTPPDMIKRAFFDASLGRISARDFWLAAGFEKDETAVAQAKYLNDFFTLDDGFIDCARLLSKRYKLALLSNDISEWSGFLRGKYGISEFICPERTFISSDLGLRKPDPEIYKKVLGLLGVKRQECVFIDDYPDRVDAAAELGITGILFNRAGHSYNGLQVRSFGDVARLLL